MWEPYLKLICENCSEALHILDRFHIVANMNKALDNVRAEETSRMRREGPFHTRSPEKVRGANPCNGPDDRIWYSAISVKNSDVLKHHA